MTISSNSPLLSYSSLNSSLFSNKRYGGRRLEEYHCKKHKFCRLIFDVLFIYLIFTLIDSIKTNYFLLFRKMLKSKSMFRIGRRIFCLANSQGSVLCPISSSIINGHTNFSTSLALNRSKFRHSRFHIPVLWELHRRREEVGPEEAKHRSEYPNWNYDAELYGFCKRLNEEWTRETLVEAFTERSYAEAEEERRKSLRAKRQENVEEVAGETSTSMTPLITNDTLAQQGENLIRQFASSFLQQSLPNYPKEGVK